ncbi:hypothetical protein [Acinetobacter sp. YH12096]|uniref:hypothetical protein n=1 Tax=Acinetobacter sp. YH12096 TaxID=2601085 RepID=UPI0015D301EB|nr:hypothetical protein [Acinetobacter sp. YH12096]
MKKLMSSLMIGLIATTATMSAMAAPAFDHKNPPPAAHFDKKPVPPKATHHKSAGPHMVNKEHQQAHAKFAKQNHKAVAFKGNQHKPVSQHKLPPMPPKHR